VTLIRNDANVGFGRANNLAIRRGSSPYILLVNPDTQVTPGALPHLLELMEADGTIGMCGCRLERVDGTFDHASKRSFPTVIGALAHFTGVGRRRGVPRALAQYRAPDVESGAVEAINGAFMLIRREALEEVGLFDEGYWMYMDDLDLCYRFGQAGWLIWYEPRVRAIHVKAGTTGRVRGTRLNYAFHYGMFRFYRKHYAPGRSTLVNGVVYGGIAAKLVVSIVRSGIRRNVRWSRPSTSRP
jgi:GT2 family glycosyltransferase